MGTSRERTTVIDTCGDIELIYQTAYRISDSGMWLMLPESFDIEYEAQKNKRFSLVSKFRLGVVLVSSAKQQAQATEELRAIMYELQGLYELGYRINTRDRTLRQANGSVVANIKFWMCREACDYTSDTMFFPTPRCLRRQHQHMVKSLADWGINAERHRHVPFASLSTADDQNDDDVLMRVLV